MWMLTVCFVPLALLLYLMPHASYLISHYMYSIVAGNVIMNIIQALGLTSYESLMAYLRVNCLGPWRKDKEWCSCELCNAFQAGAYLPYTNVGIIHMTCGCVRL